MENSPFPWWRVQIGAEGTVTPVYLGIGPAVWAGGQARLLGRNIILARGDTIAVDSFDFTRPYSVEGAVRAIPGFDDAWGSLELAVEHARLFFLTRDTVTATNQLLQVFEQGSGSALRQLRVPTGVATARRLLRVNQDTLAFNTPDHLYLLRSAWLLPTGPSAALEVAQTNLPGLPLLGEEFTWTLTLTNIGPATATDVQIENRLPNEVEFLGSDLSSGTDAFSNGTWRWRQLVLPAGGSAIAQLRVRPRLGGQFTNEIRLQANEWNPTAPNGLIRFTTNIRVGTTPVILMLFRSGKAVVLSWPFGVLQQADEVAGTFTDVPGSSSPFTNSISAPARFYRVLLQSSSSLGLKVADLPDLIAPGCRRLP